MYNVTLRRIRETLLPWKSNKYYIFLCVCACARPRFRTCVGVCMCVRACRHAYPACNSMRHNVTSFVAPLAAPYFSKLCHKRQDFRNKVIEFKMCLNAFALSCKTPVTFATSVRLSTYISAAPTARNENLSRKSKVGQNRSKITGTLSEDRCMLYCCRRH